MRKEKIFKDVYISCPVSVPSKSLVDVISLCKKNANKVLYWERGTEYVPKMLQETSKIVVVLPKGKNEEKISSLPKGVRMELLHALETGKSIYIAYRGRETGIFSLYTANISTENNYIKLGTKVEAKNNLPNYKLEVNERLVIRILELLKNQGFEVKKVGRSGFSSRGYLFIESTRKEVYYFNTMRVESFNGMKGYVELPIKLKSYD